MTQTPTPPTIAPAEPDLHRKKLSEVFQDITSTSTAPRIALGDLLIAMHGRAFGALLLIFAFPNILPTPPGVAGILGLPLIFLSAQMMLGRAPWLPQFISNRSIGRESFATLTDRATPFLQRAERALRHRLPHMTTSKAQRLLGGLCLALSLTLVLPIPFGNLMPSLAISIIALGVLERDGIWIIAGLATSVLAFIWVGSLGYALIKSALFVVMNAF